MFSAQEEQEKLKDIVQKLPETRRRLAEGLIFNCSWMLPELEKMQNQISIDGWTEQYKHGENQNGTKMSALANAYLSLQKNYGATINKLVGMIPKSITEEEASGEDDLTKWLREN